MKRDILSDSSDSFLDAALVLLLLPEESRQRPWDAEEEKLVSHLNGAVALRPRRHLGAMTDGQLSPSQKMHSLSSLGTRFVVMSRHSEKETADRKSAERAREGRKSCSTISVHALPPCITSLIKTALV